MYFKNINMLKVGIVKIFIMVFNIWIVLIVYFIVMVVVYKIENIKKYIIIYIVCVCRGK